MLYFFIYLFLGFGGIYYYKNFSRNSYKGVHLIAFLIFVYIAGMRYNLGVDYFTYAKSFVETDTLADLFGYRSYAEFKESHHWEPGFECLCVLLRTISSDPQILFLASSVICSVFLFKAIDYFAEKRFVLLSLLTYFCSAYLLQEMQALRQALAASIIYFSLVKLMQNRNRACFFYILLAASFHSSALIFLPIAWGLKKKFSFRRQIAVLSAALAVFFLKIKWLGGIISISASLLPQMGVVEQLYKYISNEELGLQRGVFATFFLYLLVYCLFLYKNRHHGYYEEDPKLTVAQNLLFYFLVITASTWEISFISMRLSWFFLFGLAICLPYMITFFKPSSRPLAFVYVLFFNFLLVRPFIFPTVVTKPFAPYQDYISCVYFGEKSTGKERAETYAAEMGVKVIFETE